MAADSAPVLTEARLREIEAAHAGDRLMERAGRAAAEWAMTLCTRSDRPVLVVAGPGNNGGDAMVVARLLRQRSFDVRLIAMGDPARRPADAREAWAGLADSGIPILTKVPSGIQWGLIVDGLFGIGLARPIEGEFAMLVRAMNAAALESACPVLALDCPSGLAGDTGDAPGDAVAATHTLSFIALKPGLLTGRGPALCGEIRVGALGLRVEPNPADGSTIGSDDIAAAVALRPRDSHKGTFGAVGILGGAPGMVGAALLAGRAALHVGAGRVYLGLLDESAPAVDTAQPELMIRPAGAIFDAPLTALAAGPGLGTSGAALDSLAGAIGQALPLVLDADALNLLAQHPPLRTALAARAPRGWTTVLTPHPGEAARLLKATVDNLQKKRVGAARQLAGETASWVALKGAGTVIAAPDGRWWINTTGNPALATAGSGDVLTGFVAALLARGIDPGPALRCAVYLHGAAADVFAAEIGETGLAASELIPIARRLYNRWNAHSVPDRPKHTVAPAMGGDRFGRGDCSPR
jgi:hydroxyethylthiazole kinase-like uncharacterized protein yjeF